MKQNKKLLFFFTHTAVINTLFAQTSPVFVNSSDNKIQELFTGEKRSITYQANKRTIPFLNNTSTTLDVVSQVFDNGVAFKNNIIDNTSSIKNIIEGKTSYHFDTSIKSSLQPIAVVKTSREAINPTYQEQYQQNIKVNSPATNGAGWVYAALLNNNTSILLSEASHDSNYCTTRFRAILYDYH